MIEAICAEIQLRALNINDSITTIYLGGGTPSLLTNSELKALFDAIRENYSVVYNAEITLEANPEDVSIENLKYWKEVGINRLSMGIQSFNDQTLQFVNRAHDVATARKALELALSSGFDNITADLMFGIPPFDLTHWERELQEILSFKLPHLSIYGLTIEPNTVFGKWQEKKKLNGTTEEFMEAAFRLAHDLLVNHGFQHYEISNYAIPGMKSKHNTSYWQGASYYGFGPGAHSYDGAVRSFNISSNPKYIKSLENGEVPNTKEALSRSDMINEYIYTRLRTSDGLHLEELKERFGHDLNNKESILLEDYLSRSLIIQNGNHIKLTLDGMLLADEICMNFFSE